ncbi:transglycosylase SLT domain-containing protein [Candidatus Dojkabacteria bacterium]|jgi:hypothetical protein|nr:transglycosylase SLT domain-containing protein [Candidatus Dojkabacteria bacterium]
MNRKNLYVLLLQNNIVLDTSQIDQYKDWIFRKTPFTPIVEVKDIKIPLTFDHFQVNGFTHTGTSQYVRELIRDIIPENKYAIVIHTYPRPALIDGPFADAVTHSVLYSNACLVELSVSNKSYGTLYQDLTHETIHCCWKMLQIKYNLSATNDTMDTYYKDDEIEASDGNREQNLIQLSRYWDQLQVAFAPPLLIRIIDILKQLIIKQTQFNAMNNIVNNDVIRPEIVKSEKWGDYPDELKRDLIKKTKLMCIQEEVGAMMTNEIVATIYAESGFNPYCVNRTNKDGTLDYGIIQANTHWYIGEGKPIASVDEALNNPEKCILVMIKRFKQNGANDWVAHKNGNYKNYLNKVV